MKELDHIFWDDLIYGISIAHISEEGVKRIDPRSKEAIEILYNITMNQIGNALKEELKKDFENGESRNPKV